MNVLYLCEITEGLAVPDLGSALSRHLEGKTHPAVRTASLSAWNLLAEALRQNGVCPLPRVRFTERGKPCFENSPLHFSLAHSGKLAAVLLSDSPCGVDVERIRPDTARKLLDRCLSPREKECTGVDFFTFWTRKECIGKYSGQGVGAHPAQTDTLAPEYAFLHFFTETLFDSAGQEYRLSALSETPVAVPIQKIAFEKHRA